MQPNVTTLANGLRIASHSMPSHETVSLGLFVAAGSRHEAEHLHGLSHLLEHMAFKGTRKRSARRIAEEIEEVGGELNAATGLDTTSYFARVLKGDEGVALGLIADILLESTFSASDLEKERGVILQEIAGADDSPDDIAYDLLHETAFPAQAVGRSILGTPDSVSAIKATDLKAFLASHYHPGAMVVAAAGAIDHEKLVRHVEALFGGLTPRVEGAEPPARYAGGIAASEKPFEQSHLLIGHPAPGFHDEAYFAAQVFSGLYGGGMSSRLFQEIRERRGLCYAIYASMWGLKDLGLLSVHAATAPDTVEEIARLAGGELRELALKGPTAGELQRAKAQLRAGLLMALESSGARAEQMARHLITHGRIISAEELSECVAAVSAKNIRDFAASLETAKPVVAIVGSGKSARRQAGKAATAFQSAAWGA